MPRMELRGVEEGNPFYYNTEGGGALSGFGTIRLWNTAGNLSIYFNSSNGHVDNAGSNVNIYNDYSNCMIWNGGNNVNIQLTNGISTLITGGNSLRINATGNAPCWNAITGSDISINLDSGDDFVGGGEDGVVTDSTINMGAGNDTVNIGGGGSNININAGENDDYVGLQYTSYTTAYGGNGNDTIFIHDNSSNILANAGAGNDTIWHTSDCSSVTINCGDGDDYVDINIGSSNVTIQSGTGSDRISNGGNDVLIELEGDNNFVKTTGSNVTIRSGAGSDSVNVYAGVMNIPYVFEYADGDGHDVVTKDVQIYLSDSALIPYPVIDGNDIVYYIGSGSIRVLDGANSEQDFFINKNNPEGTEHAKYNVPEINLDYLKQLLDEQVDINFEGFLNYCDTDPIMKSILNDGINSPYLVELSPEIAEQIANSYKDSYETAKNLQNLNSENDYQTAYLKLKNTWNDAVGNLNDLLSNVAGILEIADVDDLNSLLSKNDTRAKLLSTIATRAQLLFSIKDSSDKTKLLAKLKKDFKNKYPNADIDEGLEIEQYKNIFGDTQRLIYPNFKIREIAPDFYDNIRLLEIDAEYAKNSVFSNIGAMILSANSPVIGAIVTGRAVAGVASGVAVGAMIPIWMSAYSISKKAAEKANYLDGVHLGAQNWYLTWGEQFLGLDYGTVKNWLKGKTGGESPDLVSNYVITNGVVNAISGDVANDGSLDHATLTGSEENDTLVNSGDYSLIEGYNGDNVVINVGDWSTITTGNGNDSVINIGDYSILVVGAGNDTFENGGEGVTIESDEGDDYITNSGNFTVINSGNGADYIDNVGDSVQINTGTGDDDVENFGNNVIINAGNGVDYIIDFGSSNSINAGNGDDFIDVEGGYNNIIAYADGEGNDSIYGYNESDILNLTGGTVKNTVASGEDLIINFETNSLNLKNAANLHVTYVTNLDSANSIPMLKSDNVYTYTGGDRKIENYSPNEKVKLSSDFTGIGVEGNNFLIKSSSGALTLENVRDKLIDVAGADGNTAAYVYMPSGEGDVNGGGIDIFEVIVASEESNNQLIAGNGGSSLIGGGGVNILQGGAGQDAFVYKANNDIINNYQSGEFINFAASYTGWATDGNDFILNAAEGSLRITDAKDKLVEVAGADGNLAAHVYKADSYEGTIDGRGFNKFEVIIGADNANNQIFADAAGSSMWGGRGASDDELFGNTGVDEYIYSYGNGHDNIFQAGNEDTVNLLNISLEQIAGAEITDNGVIARFTDGGSLNISGQAGNFKLGGQTFHADYQNKIWC